MTVRPAQWFHDDETGRMFAIVPRADGVGDDQVDGDVVTQLPALVDAVDELILNALMGL